MLFPWDPSSVSSLSVYAHVSSRFAKMYVAIMGMCRLKGVPLACYLICPCDLFFVEKYMTGLNYEDKNCWEALLQHLLCISEWCKCLFNAYSIIKSILLHISYIRINFYTFCRWMLMWCLIWTCWNILYSWTNLLNESSLYKSLNPLWCTVLSMD